MALAPARLNKTEAHTLLRQILAHVWLEKNNLSVPSIENYIPSLPAVIRPRVQALLTPLTAHPEGTPHTLTPELIGRLGEFSSTQFGVFYTPFSTARQLARETLFAWLKQNRFLPPDALTPDGTLITASKQRAADRALARLTVCDPACGAGGLLIPFWLELAALRQRLNPAHPYGKLLLEIAQNNLYAADIDPQAIEDLRLRMSLTLAAHQRPLPSALHLFVHDSLCVSWQRCCPEVFEKGGFDIYLANPPYIGQKNHKEIFAALRRHPHWADRIPAKSDILYLFFHLAFELLAPGGAAGLLTTSYFARAQAGYTLRQRLKAEACLWRLIDFGEEKLFARAKGQHNLITVFSPRTRLKNNCWCGSSSPVSLPQKELFFGPQLFLETCPPEPVLQHALAKMAAAAHTLKEVATVSNGLMTGCDRAFILTQAQKEALPLTRQELKKLQPFFKNSDIRAYAAAQKPRYFLIDFFFPNDRHTDFSRYPHLLAHLAQFKERLLARKQNNNGIHKQLAEGKYWFGSVRRKLNFEAEKIVVPHRAGKNTFAYTNGPWYASSDVYFISSPKPGISLWYLLALLNSAPYYAWLKHKGKRKGHLLELYSAPLGQVPIPQANTRQRALLEKLARQIYIQKTKDPAASTAAWQRQIDKTVCRLFNFSPSEEKTVYSACRQ